MANLININAETGADIIGDDAQPTLTLKNTSTGPALKLVGGLVLISGATLEQANLIGGTAGSPAAIVKRSVVGSQSVGVLKIYGPTTASGAYIEFTARGFISLTSIKNDAAYTDYAIPVQVGLETRYMILYQSGAISGGAAI